MEAPGSTVLVVAAGRFPACLRSRVRDGLSSEGSGRWRGASSRSMTRQSFIALTDTSFPGRT